MLSAFLPAPVFRKTLIWTLPAKILSVVCWTCGVAEIVLHFVVSLDLVFHVCVVSKGCSCVLNSTVGIPSLWQPAVTHCLGACLGRKRGREGKVHRDFKKLLSLPLNTLFDTPQHRPSGGMLCKPHRPLLQSLAPAWLSPGMQGATQNAFRYCITVWSQGSAFEWKTQVSLKELGIWSVANSFYVTLLFTSPCPPFSFRLDPGES